MEPATASAAWLTDKLRGWAVDRLLEKLNPRIDPLRKSLDNLNQHALDADAKLDDALIAPMREGVRRWQLGDLDKAIDKLLEAEARNPLAPMPRIWLALACASRLPHWSEAQAVVALDLLRSATCLNPYAIQPWLSDTGSTAQRLFSAMPTSTLAGPDWKPWEKDLESPEVIRAAAEKFKWPKMSFWTNVDPSYRQRTTSAIARASVCGASAAIQWLLADHFLNRVEVVLALFRLDTGEMQWGRHNTDEELVFATYEHVVVRRKDHRYSLLNLGTGEPDANISTRYFECMFGEAGPSSAAFRDANWSGTTPDEAYEKSARGRISRVGDPASHIPVPFPEGKTLRDPCGLHNRTFTVANEWTHDHFSPSGGSLAPYCHLLGGAMIKFE